MPEQKCRRFESFRPAEFNCGGGETRYHAGLINQSRCSNQTAATKFETLMWCNIVARMFSVRGPTWISQQTGGVERLSQRGAHIHAGRVQIADQSPTANDSIQNSGWCRWRIRCKSGRIHIVSSSLTSPPNFAVTPSAQRAVLVKCCDEKSALNYSRADDGEVGIYVQLQRPIKDRRETPSALHGGFCLTCWKEASESGC